MNDQELQILKALVHCPLLLDLETAPPELIYTVITMIDDAIVDWVVIDGCDFVTLTDFGRIVVQDYLTENRESPYTTDD